MVSRLLALRMPLLLQDVPLEGSWRAEDSSFFSSSQNNTQKKKEKEIERANTPEF